MEGGLLLLAHCLLLFRMQQLYVCSSRYHYHYCRFIATSALLHLAALHFGAFRIIQGVVARRVPI